MARTQVTEHAVTPVAAGRLGPALALAAMVLALSLGLVLFAGAAMPAAAQSLPTETATEPVDDLLDPDDSQSSEPTDTATPCELPDDPSELPVDPTDPDPSDLPTDCELPEDPTDLLPGGDDASPEPSPSPTSPPSPQPSPTGSPSPPVIAPDSGSGGGFPSVGGPPPSVGDAGIPAPEVAEPVGAPQPAPQAEVFAAGELGISPLAASLPGAFGIGLLTALLAAGVAFGAHSLTQRGILVARTLDGGIDVKATSRMRTMAGLALLAAAAIVGIIGFLRISVETLVPVQVVYLASAGFGVVILAIAGGSLLIADQLRADEDRIKELEGALIMLAEQMHGQVTDPPRLLDREGTDPLGSGGGR